MDDIKDISVTLEGLGSWKVGREIIDIELQLGQNENGNTCQVTLADKDGFIANSLVAHSLTSGGIAPVGGTSAIELGTTESVAAAREEPTMNPIDAAGWEIAIVKGCIANGVTDRNQIAYVLATVWKETTMGVDLVNESAIFEGNGELGNTVRGDGKRFIPRGIVQITGRGNYRKASKLVGVDLLKNPELLQQARYTIPASVLGMKQGTFTGAKLSDYINGSKVDFYNARRIINSTESAQVIADKAKNVYLPKVASLIAKSNSSTIGLTPKLPIAPNGGSIVSNTAQGTAPKVLKGNKITLNFDDLSFEFYHQGTRTTERGETKITGQGIRWVLNRRTRNKTEKTIKLSELAAKIAKAHKLTLSYQATIDPVYEHIDQTGLTDYQLLKRECERSGLFLSETNGTLTIKSLDKVQDTAYIAAVGVNLISYDIQDAAIDTYADDNASSALQAEPKVELDPLTGSFTQQKLDIDPVKDVSSTGKDKSKVAGTLAPGQEAVTAQYKARTKRVKGLPSTFVLPLDGESLALKPLDVIRTRGIGKTFDRVWLIDKVSHSAAGSTTTLNCYSPIEVLDTGVSSPTVQTSENTKSTAQVPSSASLANISYKNEKLLRTAILNQGMSSYNAPGTNNGRVACVWAVNQIFAKAGIPNPWRNSLAVKSAKAALKGVAVKVPVSQAKPGDIVLWDGAGSRQHIGIVLADGATEVISNSSSKASWSWRASHQAVAPYYGGAPTEIYRLR